MLMFEEAEVKSEEINNGISNLTNTVSDIEQPRDLMDSASSRQETT